MGQLKRDAPIQDYMTKGFNFLMGAVIVVATLTVLIMLVVGIGNQCGGEKCSSPNCEQTTEIK